MTRYRVDLPVAGYISVYVEADSKDAAISKAFDTEMRVNFPGSDQTAELGELEYFSAITEGNVCHAPRNRVEIEEIEDEA